MNVRRMIGGLAVAGALLAASCSSGPQAGELVLDLATPNQDDGAIAFIVRAGEGVEISALAPGCAGCQVFTHPVTPTEVHGVVIGDLGAGPVVRATVSDVRTPTLYVAEVREVAARTFGLRNPALYTLTPRAP